MKAVINKHMTVIIVYQVIFDKDGSGRITATELQAALANGKGGTFSESACKLMINMFGHKQNGTIDVVEFQDVFKYINSWIDFLRSIDLDNSGSIQENELNEVLIKMGYKVSPKFVQFLMQKCDPGNCQSMSVDQFIVFCIQLDKFTDPIKYESDPQNHVSMSIWTKQARKRIQEYARLWRARHILDAISFINELFVDSSEVEILSLVNVIARRLKFLGVPDSSENKQCDVSNSDKKLFLLNQGHSGIYHCCTFCSSGGKKDVVCACEGRMPGGYRGCGHGHVGHPGSNHWSCCGSLLRDGRCLITRRYKYQFLL
ncbi:hypothetical protein HZH66_014092 [Vespula vulgaris]|uniref:EF-hand domain-containing protein n=1 Tax=Vespula vulgaris TaxID=7454 RepID=A0A834J816_VESVU|nr:hypothetical protein HZH66_014092 [Vespula vulgaris]